jgi:hypothetical protein
MPGHIPAISPLRPISPMESAIHDVHTALNRPGVTGTKSRRSAHCVDGDKDQTADAAEKWFEENDREGVAFEYEVLHGPANVPELTGSADIKLNTRVSLQPILAGLAWWQVAQMANSPRLYTARLGAASPSERPRPHVARALLHTQRLRF